MSQGDFSCAVKDEGQEKIQFSARKEETAKDERVRVRVCQNLFLSSRKNLLISFLCAIFFCFGVLVTRLIYNQNQDSLSAAQNNDSGSSASSKVTDKIPVDLDPCDDFYEFACASPASLANRTVLEAQFLLVVQLILGNGHAENGAEEKAQNFYKSCVNAAADPKSMLLNEQLTKILEKLEKIPHGNLQKKLELFQVEYGFNPFFTWSIFRDFGGTNSTSFTISSELDDPKEERNFTSLLKSSDRLKSLVAEILGHRLNFSTKSNDLDQLVNLDKEIRELSQSSLVDRSESQSDSNNVMNLTQLQNIAGFINWKNFFNSGLEKLNLNLTIKDDDKIITWCSHCLSKLSKKFNYLANSTAESQKLLDKFLIWQAGTEMLVKMLNAVESPVSAPATCATLTLDHFDLAVTSMHRRHVLKKNPNFETGWMEAAQNMAENIRHELILVLKETAWLDDKSRDGMIEKARKAQILFGYPENVKNSTSLEQLYEGFPEMSESDFIGNMMTLLKFQSRKNRDSNTNAVDIATRSDALDDNASAISFINTIVIPARKLLPPNFDPNPESSESMESVNYGRLGWTIGHEFFHGYAKSGSNWDANGEFQSQSLWKTKETREKMENRSSCLIHQYSRFSYPDGKSLNGTYFLEENFADNGGLDVATRALFRLLDKTKVNNRSLEKCQLKQSEILNHVDDKKMFFIAFAQAWCTDEPSKFSADSHSPEKFRILGALQNPKAFSDAFQCQSKSRMNPQEKCSIF